MANLNRARAIRDEMLHQEDVRAYAGRPLPAPGAWEYDGQIRICTKVQGHLPGAPKNGYRWTLARLHHSISGAPSPMRDWETVKATGRLMAQAPRLLAALKELHHVANSIGEDTADPLTFASALEEARLAIIAAEKGA